MNLSCEGIVLRDISRDEDRILSILTRSHGVLTAFANKARRPRSALASSTELLCFSHFEIFQNRDRSTVDKADSIHSFFGLRARVEDLALACWLAQLTQELAPRHDAADDYIDLLLTALHLLEQGKRPRPILKAAYEFRLLTMTGYMPDLVGCAECGANNPDGMLFSTAGSLYCPAHEHERERAPAGATLHAVGGGVLAAMRHAVYAEPKKVFSFTLSEEGAAALGRVAEAFVLYQVEKTFPALEFYRSVM